MQKDPFDRVWAMVNNKDCPVDLTGLDSFDRARVMGMASPRLVRTGRLSVKE